MLIFEKRGLSPIVPCKNVLRREPHPDGTLDKWRGTSDSGVKIDGFEKPKATAYPVYSGVKK